MRKNLRFVNLKFFFLKNALLSIITLQKIPMLIRGRWNVILFIARFLHWILPFVSTNIFFCEEAQDVPTNLASKTFLLMRKPSQCICKIFSFSFLLHFLSSCIIDSTRILLFWLYSSLWFSFEKQETEIFISFKKRASPQIWNSPLSHSSSCAALLDSRYDIQYYAGAPRMRMWFFFNALTAYWLQRSVCSVKSRWVARTAPPPPP